MRILWASHWCASRMLNAGWRNAWKIVKILAFLALICVTLTMVWDNTPHWRATTLGCKLEPSVLGILQSEMRMSHRNCDSREEINNLSANDASTIIGVFIVVDRCGDVSENEANKNDFYLIDCQKQFVYYVYILSNHSSSSRGCSDFWAERLSIELARCRTSSRQASGWIISVAVNTNIIFALNSVMIEAYIGNVTWFDVVMITNFGKSAQVLYKAPQRAIHAEPSEGNAVAVASFSVDDLYETTRVVIHKLHYEISGAFFSRSLSTMADASQYIKNVFTHCGNREKAYKLKGGESTNNVTDQVRKTCSLAVRYWSSKSPRQTTSEAPRRTISMSLYGAKPLYTMGAVRNAQLAPILFPGWRLRFYCAPQNSHLSVSSRVISKLKNLGAEIVYVKEGMAKKLAPMIWRFMIADDPTDEAFLIRDADSRFSQREATAVNDWLSRTPRKTFHCMRDHPWHRFSIMGGMWGARTQELRALLGWKSLLSAAWQAFEYKGEYLDDMKFLNALFWTNYSSHFYCHDSVTCKDWNQSHPFPSARVGYEHVGQVFNAYSEPNENHLGPLKNLPSKSDCD